MTNSDFVVHHLALCRVEELLLGQFFLVS